MQADCSHPIRSERFFMVVSSDEKRGHRRLAPPGYLEAVFCPLPAHSKHTNMVVVICASFFTVLGLNKDVHSMQVLYF